LRLEYIVTVRRSNDDGRQAVDKLNVRVGPRGAAEED